MNITIHTNILEKMKEDEIEITINAKNNSSTLNKIIENIQNVSDNIDTVIGIKENNIFIINVLDIICFYSEEQGIYCKTNSGNFRIKKKLYELEEGLEKSNFIRISNSCIINIKYVESFDLGMIGNIIVKFKDKTYEYVSRRRIPKVMEFLKERGN